MPKKKKTVVFLIALLLPACGGFDLHPRPWTNEERALAVTSTIATFFDGRTSMKVMNDGGYERNHFYFGKNPSDERLIAVLSLTQLGALAISNWWPDLRIKLLGFKTLLNTGCAVYSSQH